MIFIIAQDLRLELTKRRGPREWVFIIQHAGAKPILGQIECVQILNMTSACAIKKNVSHNYYDKSHKQCYFELTYLRDLWTDFDG